MRYIWGVLIVFLLMSTSALAASGHITDASWTDLKYRTITFVIFVGIMLWLCGRKVKDFYIGRRQKIVQDIEDLGKDKADAKARLAEIESHIANLKKEGEAIIEDYRKQGESIQNSIIARAEQAAAQITEQAKFTIDNETKMATANLRESVADLVAEACEDMLKKQLGDEEHTKLIDKYLNKVVLN